MCKTVPSDPEPDTSSAVDRADVAEIDATDLQTKEVAVSFNAGDGAVILSHDKEKDTITLYPGGEYTRIEEVKK